MTVLLRKCVIRREAQIIATKNFLLLCIFCNTQIFHHFKILIKPLYVFQDQKSLQQQMRSRQLNNPVLLNAQNIPQNSLNSSIPLPVINLLQGVPHTQIICTPIANNNNIRNINDEISPLTKYAMSPLSLNISSPMYSLPPSPSTSNYNSPNYSPAMSPVQRDRVLSPYSTPQSLSPVNRFQKSPGSILLSPTGIIQGSDPYLNNKMQPSPGFPLQSNDLLLESNMSLSAPDFWTEPDVLTGASDLLTAFDDVKLV